MYDLVVLGGGSGGLNLAVAAARVGARVALIEKHQLGGGCTHSACVPSKALIHASRLAHQIRTADRFGIKAPAAAIDFAAVMARVRGVVAEFAGSNSGDSLRAQGIEVFHGSPAFEAHDTVVIDGTTRLHAQRFVIATGSRPSSAEDPRPGRGRLPHERHGLGPQRAARDRRRPRRRAGRHRVRPGVRAAREPGQGLGRDASHPAPRGPRGLRPRRGAPGRRGPRHQDRGRDHEGLRPRRPRRSSPTRTRRPRTPSRPPGATSSSPPAAWRTSTA